MTAQTTATSLFATLLERLDAAFGTMQRRGLEITGANQRAFNEGFEIDD